MFVALAIIPDGYDNTEVITDLRECGGITATKSHRPRTMCSQMIRFKQANSRATLFGGQTDRE